MLTLLEMRALISDGHRGLTAACLSTQIVAHKSVKTRTRSAGGGGGEGQSSSLCRSRLLSADLRDLFATCNPAAKRRPTGSGTVHRNAVVLQESKACNTLGGGGGGSREPRGTATMCFSDPRQMKPEPAELRGPKTPRYILYNWRGEIK